ncbi:acyltransferase family protein [Arenibaculum pallidiluteum]|uniref:acyltransferase family protein n=1 Tax=Arenibaculum pallidiluteum TaxID=2812559 RepID=UPI001A96EE0D|nr:acyltransferase [Arenibaculum pallidiluteum]
MDALRGIAIMLVVFEHSTRFVHIELEQAFIAVIDPLSDTLNPVRMPAMAFLSGLLLAPSLAKGPGAYVWGKVRNVLWPFLVWSFLYITAWIAAMPITGTPHSYVEMAAVLWDPPGHLWYLRDLFVFYLLGLAIHALPAARRPAGRTALMLGFAAASVLACALAQAAGLESVQRLFFLAAFFLLGGWFSAAPVRLDTMLRTPSAGVAVVVLAALLVPVAAYYGNIRYDWRGVPLTLAGIGALMLVARVLCRTPASAPLRYMGRNSLTIYVFHWIVVSSATILVVRLVPGITAAALTVLIFGLGMGASIAMVELVRRIPALDALFSFPRMHRRRAAGDSQPAPAAATGKR